jgi:5-methylcytosine-specific restriction endonuclease McrA
MSPRDTDRYAAWVAGGCKPSPSRPTKRPGRYGFGATLLQRMVIEQGHVCASCGGPLVFDKSHPNLRPTFDHVTPRALGGGNLRNRVAMHGICNRLKADRAPNGCELVMLAAVNARIAA